MTTPKTYADRLRDYCGENTQLLKDITNHLSFSNSAYSNFLKKEVGKVTERERRNIILRAAFLYLSHNIPLEVFDVKREEVFTDYSPRSSSLVKYLDMAKLERDGKSLIEEYPKALKEYISKAKEKIWIYDYFIPEASKARLFKKAHEEYYGAIERQLLENPKLKYHRLLAFTHEPNKVEIKNSIDVIRKVIRQCSDIAFKHIVKCFTNFDNRFTLSFAYIPFRLYSYAIIDEEYIISEFLRYTNKSLPKPDILFINKIEGHKDMEELQKKYINTIEDQEHHKKIIRKKTFKQAVRGVLNTINAEIEECDSRIKVLSTLSQVDKNVANDEKMNLEEQKLDMLEKEREKIVWKTDYLKEFIP